MPRVNYRETTPSTEPTGGPIAQWFADRPQMPYLIPFLAFVALMMPASFGHFAGIDWQQLWRHYHPLLYAARTLLAAILLWLFWNHYTPIRWTRIPLGILVGLVGTVVWIATEYACQHIGLAARPDPANFYNPDLELPIAWQRLAYLCIRVAGPTLVVPIFEELFFRDFLMRALIRGARFEDVPVGAFTWFSLIGMSLLFGLNHGIPPAGGWPQGILYGLMLGILLIRTKSLGACIAAHATTNLTLYLYVIYTADWQFM